MKLDKSTQKQLRTKLQKLEDALLNLRDGKTTAFYTDLTRAHECLIDLRDDFDRLFK